jgi:hypothetical protein
LDDVANRFLLEDEEKPALQNISLDILDEVIALLFECGCLRNRKTHGTPVIIDQEASMN